MIISNIEIRSEDVKTYIKKSKNIELSDAAVNVLVTHSRSRDILKKIIEEYREHVAAAIVEDLIEALKKDKSENSDSDEVVVSLTVDDVQKLKPEWSEEKCREALKELRPALTELGVQILILALKAGLDSDKLVYNEISDALFPANRKRSSEG